jgi:hypothetical protein
MKLLSQMFTELQDTTLKNIANDLLQLHFHQNATDTELQKYYGGAMVDREALISDTRGRLEGDQDMLKFLQANMSQLKILYGTKNPTGDLGLPLRTSFRNVAIEGGEYKDVGGDGGENSEQNSNIEAGHGNADSETNNG